jgi:hypothetical protein
MTHALQANEASGLLLADRHRSIETILSDVEALILRRSFATATKRLGELDQAMEKHARAEEEIWLPQIGQRWPELAPKLSLLTEDHQALRLQMSMVRDCFSAWDGATAALALARLKRLIEAHHAREEELVYPAVVALYASKPR